MKQILCVEDNQETILILKSVLKNYFVDIAQDLRESRQFLNQKKYDLITLDLGLPDGDGLKFLEELASNDVWKDIPVFILTAHEETPYKVSAFSLGAYDYIVKPFDSNEFVARIEAIFRRISSGVNSSSALTPIRCGDLIISIPKQKVWINGEVEDGELVALTSLEFRLLLNLAQAQGKVLSRTSLLKEIWGEDMHVTDRTVDTHIGHLRKKINNSKVQIQTVVGEGYKIDTSRVG